MDVPFNQGTSIFIYILIPATMKKYLLILFLFIGYVAPSSAVFNEKDLPKTLSVLRFELKTANDEFTRYGLRYDKSEILQHAQLMAMLDKCDELSLMLYSQKQDFTFDLTYACHEVNDMYKQLQIYRAPYLAIMRKLNIEVERYKDLKQSLERIPAVSRTDKKRTDFTNRKMQEDRRACLAYVNNLLKIYSKSMKVLWSDDVDYALATKRLKELNNYSQKRYGIVKEKIFVLGQTNYIKVLSDLPTFASRAYEDAVDKYQSGVFNNEHSEWRGPMVVGFIFFVLISLSIAVILSYVIVRILTSKVKRMKTASFRKRRPGLILFFGSLLFAFGIMIAQTYLSHNFFTIAAGLLEEYAFMLAVVLASLLLRLRDEQIKHGLNAYAPIIVMGLIVITFRVIFIPNRMLNLIFPPLLIVFIAWQMYVIHKVRDHITQTDSAYAWVSLLAMVVTAVVAWCGYILLSVQIIIWWLFQLTVIATITTCYHLLKMYYKYHLTKRLRAFHINHKMERSLNLKGIDIQITWLYDFIQLAVIPILLIYSIPYCSYLAADIFDLSIVCRTFFSTMIINAPGIIQIYPEVILYIASLAFLFFYLNYAVKAFYRNYRMKSLIRKDGTLKLHANLANLNLFENIISILIWGVFALISMVMLNIPKEGISLVTAGLATGVGFAMKDILNNFFYGIQLMAGRVHIGDIIECDGVRGSVESITYQSTQILTGDGCVMAFLNSDLFRKNFKNLTKNHDYELVIIPVGVAYGCNIENVRQIILQAVAPLDVKDENGRDVVSKKRDVTVDLQNFGDNSVDLAVKQLVLVDKEFSYKAQARELIYNALNDNKIEIPFPQRDIYIRQMPTDK